MKARFLEESIKVLMPKLIFPSAMEREPEKLFDSWNFKKKKLKSNAFSYKFKQFQRITFLICFIGLHSTVCIYTSHCSKISNSVSEEGTGIVF